MIRGTRYVSLVLGYSDREREAKVRIEVVRPGDAPAGSEPSRKVAGQRRLDVDDAAADAARGLRRDMMYGVYGLVEGEIGSGPAHLEPSRQGA